MVRPVMQDKMSRHW